jgi:hypothetical protein
MRRATHYMLSDSTFRTNVGEFDTPLPDEFQGFVHVLGLLNAHSGVFIVPPEGSIS